MREVKATDGWRTASTPHAASFVGQKPTFICD